MKPSALPASVRAIPIVGPDVTHLIGLVVPQRFAISPLTNALVREGRAVSQFGRRRPKRPDYLLIDRYVLSRHEAAP